MLSTVNSFGPSAAIVALGYAADWGNTYYENRRESLSSCEKNKQHQIDQLADAAKNLDSSGHVGVSSGILVMDDMETLGNAVYLIFARHDLERQCSWQKEELSSFTATYLAPCFPLISDASLPAAGLVLVAKIASALYALWKHKPKGDC